MSSESEGGKKRVNTRGRKPPEIVKKAGAPAADPQPPRRGGEARGRGGEGAGRPAPGRGGGGHGGHGGHSGQDAGARSTMRIGGERTAFGTRISRRIACSRCQKEDHVPYVPRDLARALCRDCAQEVLKAVEVGVKIRVEMRKASCNLCGKPFELPASVPDDGDPLCPDCLRGFTAWSGSLDTPFAERQRSVVQPTANGAVVRRRAPRDDP